MANFSISTTEINLDLKFVHANSISVAKELINTEEDLSLKDCYVLVRRIASLISDQDLTITYPSDTFLGYGLYGTVEIYGFIQNNTSKLYIFGNWGNKDILVNNIEVTFPTYALDENGINPADYINGCTFGKVYTDKYAQNRLMVSGNNDFKNCDWWTNDVNVYMHQDDKNINTTMKSNDFIYFPSDNYCFYGGDNSKIVGYETDSAGKLIVFKEFANGEPTIYFREGVQNYAYQDTTSGAYFYDYELNMLSGNAGVSPLNPFAITNFNGRTIFISNEKNVDILTEKSALLDNSKYATTCSHYINAKVKEYSLDYLTKNSFLYVYGKWLYFVIGQIIYMARYDELSSDTLQYEWYVVGTGVLEKTETFTDIFGVDGTLYFVTSKGNIFRYENENSELYQDNKKLWLEEGDFTDSVLSNAVLAKCQSGDRLFTNYYLKLNIPQEVVGERLYLRYESEPQRKLLANLLSTEKLLITLNNDQYKLYFDADGYYIMRDSLIDLYTVQDENFNLIIKDVDNDNVMDLAFEYDGEYLKTELYNPTASYSGYIEHYANVSAVYVTAPQMFGTLNSYKNIIGYTITNDTRKASEIYLAIISNSIPLAEAKYIGSNSVIVQMAQDLGITENDIFAFSLDSLDFTTMSLTQDYVAARSKTVYRNIMRQRFTDFVFYNKNATNAVLSTLTLSYKITTPVVGGE